MKGASFRFDKRAAEWEEPNIETFLKFRESFDYLKNLVSETTPWNTKQVTCATIGHSYRSQSIHSWCSKSASPTIPKASCTVNLNVPKINKKKTCFAKMMMMTIHSGQLTATWDGEVYRRAYLPILIFQRGEISHTRRSLTISVG